MAKPYDHCMQQVKNLFFCLAFQAKFFREIKEIHICIRIYRCICVYLSVPAYTLHNKHFVLQTDSGSFSPGCFSSVMS